MAMTWRRLSRLAPICLLPSSPMKRSGGWTNRSSRSMQPPIGMRSERMGSPTRFMATANCLRASDASRARPWPPALSGLARAPGCSPTSGCKAQKFARARGCESIVEGALRSLRGLQSSHLLVWCRRRASYLPRFGFFNDAHLARGVIGDAKHGKVFDLGLHAVALEDALAPGPAVERLGVFEALPLINTAGDTALAAYEMLADETLHRAETGSDPLVVVAAGGTVDVAGQAIAHDGGNHLGILLGSGSTVEARDAR